MDTGRFSLLGAAAAAGLAVALSGCAAVSGGKDLLCLAGSNAGSRAPIQEREAFRVLAVDPDTGAFREVSAVKGIEGTTYFALSRDGSLMYTIRSGGPGGSPSCLMCFKMADSGEPPSLLQELPLPCEAPCHISLSPDGTKVAFAAYGSAVAGLVDLATKEIRTVKHEGKGPRADRQEKAHAHCAFFTPAGDRVGVVDLGIDQVRFYDMEMKPDESMTIKVEPGLGPRHVVFSPDGRFMFLVHELGNAVSSYRFDGRRFELVDTKSTLPPGFKDFSKAAAVKLTADGRVLMASNRGHDSIAFFDVDTSSGALSPRRIEKLAGKFPRDFELVPGEKFMIVGHKMSDEIQMYSFNRAECSISPVGAPMKAFRPLCFKFVP